MNGQWLLITFLAVLIVLPRCYNAASKEKEEDGDDDEEKNPVDRLLDKILDEDVYDTRIRPPIFDENGTKLPLIVNVSFALYTFIDMDEILEEGSAFMFLWERWWDPRLAWDPAEYGGVDLLTLETADIWFPDVFIYQLWTGQNDDKGSRTHARVQAVRQGDKYNAQVTLAYGALFVERCPMDMMYYPFDQQSCRFCMGAMANTNSQVIFQAEPRIKDRRHATIGGEWILVNAVGVDVIYREFSISCVDVFVKRRSAFFGVNLFFPTLAVCLLNTVGLFSKLEESHTQVDIANVGQTTLLNLGIIMLTIATDQTPKGAIISFLGAFFVIMISQSLVASITAMCLRHRITFKERRALRAAYREFKEKEQKGEKATRCCIFSSRKRKVFTISNPSPVMGFNGTSTSNQRGNDSDSDTARPPQEDEPMGPEPKLIRWERICMWLHICFILIMAVALTVVGMILSPPVAEWNPPPF